MSYEDSSQAVRLDGADRERAESHTADALKELVVEFKYEIWKRLAKRAATRDSPGSPSSSKSPRRTSLSMSR